MSANYITKAKGVIHNSGKSVKLQGKTHVILGKIPMISTLRALKRVPELCRMVNAYARKEYTQIPQKTVLMAVGGLIYLVSPIDAYPDVLPGGYIDDALVLEQILNAISDDVDEFSEWRKREYRKNEN